MIRSRSGTDIARSLRQQMTDAERRLWRHLRAHRLEGAKFRRQWPLGRYVVDFICLPAKLVVEVDGGQHADSESDRIRDGWLEAQGYRVLRFWNNEVLQETDAVLERIVEWLDVPPSPPLPLSPALSPKGERGRKAEEGGGRRYSRLRKVGPAQD
jgi:very-short-patch-repair endonuclease